MAKKQTRRSISVSRTTYERLKAFCETQNISMSQFVETRVGDFLSSPDAPAVAADIRPRAPAPPRPIQDRPLAARTVQPVRPEPTPAMHARSPMTSAAARYAVEPPPPIIKPREPVDAKPPTPPTADQIFTF
jgi:hypothetical protein